MTISSEVSRLRILTSGISGGIGRAFKARAAAHTDWEVVGLARHPEAGQYPYDARWPEAQMAESLAPVGAVDALLCLHGADILSSPLRQASYLDRLDALYQVDLAGTIKLTRTVLPKLAPGGTIVVVGWDQASLGAPGEAGELYALAKGALTSWAKSLAATLIGQTTVYILAPGWVLTRWGETLPAARQARLAQRTRAGRWQTPGEVAAVLEALLRMPAGLSTGQVVYVNRGDVMPS